MKKSKRRSTRARIKRVLVGMRLNLIAFAVLIVLSVVGMWLIRSTLFHNAWETGTALANNYAAEEQSALTVYETLLNFGTASIDKRVESGESREEILEWMDIYFERLTTVLGEGAVDPYAVIDGQILAANPWDGDATYDLFATEWYQKAIEANGKVVFTDLYIDAIYGTPVITIAQKCEHNDNLLAFDILPENIRLQADNMMLEDGDSFFLCDSRGQIIYCNTEMDNSTEEIQAYLNDLIARINAGEMEGSAASVRDTDGNMRSVYYARLDNGWFSIVTILHSNILGNFARLTRLLGLLIAMFLIFLAAITWRDMRIGERIERTNETVRVLGNSYYALYRVDYGADTYEMIKGSDYVRDRIPPSGPYEDLLRTAGEVVEPEAYKDFLESFSSENIRTLVAKRVRNFGGDFLRRFGEEMRWVSVRILFDESLAPEEVVLCFQEVEEEKQRELRQRRLLENALEIAQQNETSKQSFFSNMSHDMRTPLNAIIGLSNLAGQHVNDPEKVSGYLEKINFSSRQLLGLINDILDMSRMEQGKLVLTNREFDLRKCVEECVETFRFQAEAGRKTLDLAIDLRDPMVLGDPFRIGQVLNNLLSNAVKFTREGDSISVSVAQMEPESSDYGKYRLVIADTGIGMSKDYLPHLFEPYSREMRFGERQAVGTGLGMPITQSIVTQMNGEIHVESEPGQGTTFTIILPFVIVRAPEAERPQAVAERDFSLEGRRILLAEDNEVNMEITTEILDMNGVRVTQAWNGEEALARFQESEPFAFDAILMDMQMPVMDGCEAARRIRALRRPDARAVPIIAVTANAFAEDVAATTAAGMDAHVSKPIDFAHLVKVLRALVCKEDESGG
ncbi:MAG TPA: response regulator [Candidatus Pullichristensenella stercorigallinarum]|uniref:Stage 0 sporulation protein A homolog n=1 Tax=Candidatus Pullichristensenella stercorigallinarum TaxID=2840909 RepID=A0A9D1CWS6_9FIRM|nr:response regulator [Candidatus Pullichristensenella stercorigallinarum]